MLFQTDFCLSGCCEPDLQSELAVKIHGAAMRAVPSDFAARMHTNEYHPFSIFTLPSQTGCTVRISALSRAAAVIPEAIAQQPAVRIFGPTGERSMQIMMQFTAAPATASELADRISEEGCRIRFVTPAMIRIQSRPSAAPDICGYFYSVLRKMNAFERTELDYAKYQEAFRAVRFGSYQLRSASCRITGRVFPGMTGFCDLHFPRHTGLNRLLRRVIGYAGYSGVGSKTAQGMGGILLEPLPAGTEEAFTAKE